jgi:Tfp pilus assembly protein PilF
MVLMRRGEYASARDALLKTAAQDPDSPKVAYQLSLVYARLGDDATAQRYVERYQENLRTVEQRVGALRGAK